MKKILMLIAVCALLFGCEAAAVKEVKATAVPDTENGVTMGDVFDTALQNASWKAGSDEAKAGSDEAGAETVTVTGLFDWQNGGGLAETAFTFAKNAESGIWEPVAVSAGGDTADNAFSVGLAFLMVYAVYGESVAGNSSAASADAAAPDETGTNLEPLM